MDRTRSNARVLYPRRQDEQTAIVRQQEVKGGAPITEGLAVELRTLVFGSPCQPGPTEQQLLQHCFAFHKENTVHSWRLKMPHGAGRAVCVCIQAHVLKHMLFVNRLHALPPGEYEGQLHVTASAQESSLVSALSDTVWRAGAEGRRAILCVPHNDSHFANTQRYVGDGVTERIVQFVFTKQDELTFTIKKYIREFTVGHGGLLLLLYSALLSRGLDKVRVDLCESPLPSLVPPALPPHRGVVALLLTGRCSPYCHNGAATIAGKQIIGVTTRSDIGFLAWSADCEPKKKTSSKTLPTICTITQISSKFRGMGSRSFAGVEEEGNQDEDELPSVNFEEVKHQMEGKKLGVGSRLKTPMFPVWVTLCNDTYGLLFNPNKELTRDYHAENRFELLYVSTSSTGQETSYLPQHQLPHRLPPEELVEEPTRLTLDTRSLRVDGEGGAEEEEQAGRGGTDFHTRLPPLVSLLHTKWQDADVSWNGCTPHV